MQEMTGLPLDAAALAKDIELIVGGNFTPTAIGLEEYDAVLARVRARPLDALRVFESLYLGLRFDAIKQSHWYLPSFLKHLKDRAPEEVTLVAQNLLRQYNAILIIYDHSKNKEALFRQLPDEIVRTINRLEDRRTALRLL